jgi:hypothetical protein
MKKDDYEIINKTMIFLEKINNPLSREAVVIMLDDGILTQETHFSNYVIAKNIYDAYSLDNNDNIKDVITKGLKKDKQDLIWDLWQKENDC